jgi:hypothetical protein
MTSRNSSYTPLLSVNVCFTVLAAARQGEQRSDTSDTRKCQTHAKLHTRRPGSASPSPRCRVWRTRRTQRTVHRPTSAAGSERDTALDRHAGGNPSRAALSAVPRTAGSSARHSSSTDHRPVAAAARLQAAGQAGRCVVGRVRELSCVRRAFHERASAPRSRSLGAWRPGALISSPLHGGPQAAQRRRYSMQ